MVSEDLEAACVEVARENVQLAHQASTARDEVERQARAYRQLMDASHARERHVSAIQQADEQLRHLHGQQSLVDCERRSAATQRIVFALDAVRRRFETLSKRGVICRLQGACAALRAKARLAVSALRAAMLGRLVRAWHAIVVAERLDRDAAVHLEQRMRQQRLIVLATAHWDQRRSRRIWFAWRAFMRHARNERMEELVRVRACQFMSEETELQSTNTDEAAILSAREHVGSIGDHVHIEEVSSSANPAGVHERPGDSSPSNLHSISATPCSSNVPRRRRASAAAPLERQSAREASVASDGVTDNGGRSQMPKRSASQPAVTRSVRRPKLVIDMERRAAERQQRERQRDEERCQRQRQQEEQRSSDVAPVAVPVATPAPGGAESSPTRRPEARQSKLVLEMERRAEERRVVHEERRQWHKRREEQRLAEDRAVEEAKRLEEEEEKRHHLQEQRERKRAEQRKHAEQLVAVARQRQHMRQACELWMRNRLVDVWCALRQGVIESDEMLLVAWCCYRRSLQNGAFAAWRQQQLRDRGVREACCIARARSAEWQFRRHAFRTLVAFFRLLAQRSDWQVETAKTLLAQRHARRCVGRWSEVAAKSSFEKRCMALRHYAKGLSRCVIKLWLAGAQQVRLDAELECHKQALHKKVSGWLQEIDVSGPALRNGTATIC